MVVGTENTIGLGERACVNNNQEARPSGGRWFGKKKTVLTLVQLFKRERLRLGHEEQDGEESHNVPSGVPSECTLRFERSQQTRKSNRDDKVAARVDGSGVSQAISSKTNGMRHTRAT